MKTILFQGDSITDMDRSRNVDRMLGNGYPMVVGALLGCECAGRYKFINRGIGGNRIVDVYARIKKDILNLEPDMMSMLIGVNDVWHELGERNGVDAPKFEKIYSLMIEEILEAKPDIKLMILEPFVLHGCYTNDTYEQFRPEVLLRAEASKRVAEKYGAKFVPLQKIFDELYPTQPEGYWLADGVHPTPAGHGVIAKEWMRAFKEMDV